MRPRRFYIGFPPAIAKTTRNGIEYGIGAIPLGGYVKIPGMHRPGAERRPDVHFGRALQQTPELGRPRATAQSAPSRRRTRTPRPGSSAGVGGGRQRQREHAARHPGDRGRPGADAYWRQRTWKRVAVIVAGPADQPGPRPWCSSPACSSLAVDAADANRSGRCSPASPRRPRGLTVGDRILACRQARRSHPGEIPRTSVPPRDEPFTPRRAARRQARVVLGPCAQAESTGAYRIGVAIEARDRPGRVAAARQLRDASMLTWDVTAETVRGSASLATGERHEPRLERRRDRAVSARMARREPCALPRSSSASSVSPSGS